MKTIAAIMVKNQSNLLDHCLASIDKLVDDILVVDTGSTDDTIETALAWGADVEQHRWKGWSASRNAMLTLARERSDRILLLDADMTVEGVLPNGGMDCERARLHNGTISYLLPFLVNARKPWEYRGVVHEALCCDEAFTTHDTDLFAVTHHGVTGGRLEDDKRLLEAAGAADTRNLYYLAQTYRDLGDTDAAIACYKARAELAGYDEERWHALYQAGCLCCVHRSFDEGQELLMRAWRLRPTRAEPLRALATCAMHIADGVPMPDDALFIEPLAYA